MIVLQTVLCGLDCHAYTSEPPFSVISLETEQFLAVSSPHFAEAELESAYPFMGLFTFSKCLL